MKQATLRGLIISLSFSAFIAGFAHADSRVFLLQLGSFESEAEAQTRWLTLKDKYPQLLEGLTPRTLDVTLPPDNFTVYRTQAGAMDSRSDAQIVCDRLNSAGDECYVVETAMFKPAAQAIDVERPSAIAQIAAPVIEPTIAQAPAIAEYISPEASINTAPEIIEYTEPNISLETASVVPDIIPDIDISPINTPAFDTPMPSLGQPEAEESFWSWINPFSSGKATETISAPSVKDTIELMPAEIMPPEAPSFTMAEAQPVAPVQIQQLPQPRYRLPPPPSPPGIIRRGSIAETAVPVPPLATNDDAIIPPVIPFQVKRNGQLVSAQEMGNNFIPNSSDVKVAEAIRVPVTDINRMSPAPISATKLRSLGLPSETLPHAKNMWAEVNYFNTQQEALAFWDQFRLANPSFPPVRVRVTNPYMQTSKPRVSLRVGPFEHAYMINDICAEIQSDVMSCKLVRDIGASATARMGTRTRANASNQRYAAHQRKIRTRAPMYWVQVGTFSSAAAAQSAWSGLQQRHEPLLDNMRQDVALPANSSSMDSVYRLRTGPFPMRHGAASLCSALQTRGSKCMTVFSR